MHGEPKHCVYCLSGPSIRGGLIPDLPGRFCCKEDDACNSRCEQQRLSFIPRVCIRCGYTAQGRRGLRLLDDERGYICENFRDCDERQRANQNLLGVTA